MLIGRREDLAAVAALIAAGRRLVTILGPAGMGKTSLARELIQRTGGGCFVDLTSAASSAEVAAETARALGVSERADETAVARALAARPRPLLVLDNLEHLLPEAATLIAAWLRAAPELSIVATSRETVRVSEEAVYELAPLPEAVELFVARVRDRDASYTPNAAELAMIAKIAAKLERIPLAIELAAARAIVLSLEELYARLEDRFALLAGGPRDRTPRQATMYGAIEWSWNLLDAREQCALTAASVFRGGFAVSALEALLEEGAVEVAQSLREKSLLTKDAGGRLSMYEAIREFARTKLDPADALALELAHARWFTEQAPDDRENLEAVLGHAASREHAALDELGLRAAILLDALSAGDALTESQARILDLLLSRRVSPEALLVRSARLTAIARFEDGERAAREALALAAGDERLAAQAHMKLANAFFGSGRIADTEAEAKRAAELFQRQGDELGEALALAQQGGALNSLNRSDEGLECFERARSIARRHGDLRTELAAEAGIAFRWLELAKHEPARKHFERCMELTRELGVKRKRVVIIGYIGLLELDRGRLDDALERTSVAVAEARERGEARAEGVFAAIAAAARAGLGEVDEAERDFDAAEALLRHHPFFLRVAEIHRGHIDLAKSREAAAHGDLARWRKLRAAARARLESGERAIEHSDDARIAMRILARALDRGSAPPDTRAPPIVQPELQLVLAADASWFAIGDGARVDLARRASLKSLLAILGARRESNPGEPIAIDALLAAAWPGEKLIKSAALNRLHVALATLRSLGLKDALERRGEGYLLPARIKVSRGS